MNRTLQLAVAGAALAALAGCSVFDFGRAERRAQEEADRAGRIALVLDENLIEADPNLASVAVILPDPRDVASWPQAGQRPSKVVGHVAAAEAFEIAWRRNAGEGSGRSMALTTPPVTSEAAIFVLGADQEVKAFDIETGDQLWDHRIRSGRRRDRRSVGGGLAYADGRVIAASSFGIVRAIDAASGEEIWSRKMDSPMTGSPTIIDGRVFLSSQNNEIFALEFDNGATIWSDQAIVESARVLGSPSAAAIEDFIVAPFSSGELIAYLAANGRRLWSDALTRTRRFTPISAINDVAARPVLANGLVFAASQSGVLTAIDGRSGNRIWVQPIGSTQAPVLAGEFLFVATNEGKVVCLSASTGGVVWVAELRQFRNERRNRGRITYAGPILASGRLLVASSEGELIALSPQTGEETDRLKVGGDVFLEPIAARGKVFVLTDGGRLVAVE